uniref:Putative secreted protein n=1 Tax=Ixodes ricinus TaxID=34613 RepID=A0A6B0UWC5_IXORI
MTNGRILVGAICAVVVTVALPRHGNAPTGIATLEIVLSARIPTKLLVTLVVAVIVAIANLNPWHTGGVIVALELSLFAREWRTSHFVGAIATVLVAVALPKKPRCSGRQCLHSGTVPRYNLQCTSCCPAARRSCPDKCTGSSRRRAK